MLFLVLLTTSPLFASSLLASVLLAAPLFVSPLPAAPAPSGRADVDGAPPWSAEEDGATVCSRARVAAGIAGTDRTEPTPNQKLWDAQSYSLEITVDPTAKTIAGTVDMRARVLADSAGNPVSLAYLELDLDQAMYVSAVWFQEASVDPATVQHTGDLLRIPLSRPPETGELIDVKVQYAGAPSASGVEGLNFSTVGGQPMAWGFGGPRGARRWWPCKDYPEDKADQGVTLQVTAPKGFEIPANGNRVSRTETDSSVTETWVERHAIATYLVAFTAYPYAVSRDVYRPAGSPSDSMPLIFYNVPSSQSSWAAVQAQVKDMMAAYVERYGTYPFLDEKYGHAEVPFSGGMEHQTITSLGASNASVVVHELSHSWWGDEVTCRTFGDVWLNEGLATWSEALWLEATSGPDAYQRRMGQTKYFGKGTIFVPDVSDPNRIYDQTLSYYKGSWVIHMLRHVMGDDAFFRGLRTFRSERAEPAGDGTAQTSDFTSAMSREAGRELGPMIDRWIYGEGYPIYRYDWTEATEGPGWGVRIRLRQVQDTPVFPMPVDIAVRIEGEGGDTLRTVAVESANRDSTYTINLPRRPLRVDVDPREWILRRLMPPIPAPTFAKQLLVVNGLPWRGDNAAAVRAAYESGVYTAGYDFDFWDDQTAPADGYPAALPTPLGNGPVPGHVLGRYGAVLWIGNNFGEDLPAWLQTPIDAYLEAGGNLLLLVPSARTFLLEPYRAWLGVTWAAGDSAVTSARAMDASLSDLASAGAQTDVTFFTLAAGAEGSRLLYADRGDPARGIGVLSFPAGGAGGRETGGRFVLLGGRPYRWNLDDLRATMETLLRPLLPPVASGSGLAIRTAGPNPFHQNTKVAFFLPASARAGLGVWDVGGRRVRMLRQNQSPAGWNAENWDGLDEAGHQVPSGVYFLRLDAGGKTAAGRVVRVR